MATSTAAAPPPATVDPRTISRSKACTAVPAAKVDLESVILWPSLRSPRGALALLRPAKHADPSSTRNAPPAYAAQVQTSAGLLPIFAVLPTGVSPNGVDVIRIDGCGHLDAKLAVLHTSDGKTNQIQRLEDGK